MNNLNFDIHQDLVRNDENFAYGQEWELPDNLDFDQTITILGFGRENLIKMAKDWLMQEGRTKFDSNMQCSICQFEVKCGEEVYDIPCFWMRIIKRRYIIHYMLPVCKNILVMQVVLFVQHANF